MPDDDALIVRIPGTTSNCGPGFDCLGIALTLSNFVSLKPNGKRETRLVGDYGEQRDSTQRMISEAAHGFHRRAGRVEQGFDVEVWGEVPPARGLGSSAAIRCGVVAGLNHIHGAPLDRHGEIQLASELDGAPDGVAAAFLGGFCVSRLHPETGVYEGVLRFEVGSELAMVAVSPEHQVLTKSAREVLPDSLPFQDAVRSVNSAAFIVAAFASGAYERLRGAVTDFIHQPYRQRLNPFSDEAITAGCARGAYCGWLSGSGSSIICAAPVEAAHDVSVAMAEIFKLNQEPAQTFNLRVGNAGLKVGV